MGIYGTHEAKCFYSPIEPPNLKNDSIRVYKNITEHFHETSGSLSKRNTGIILPTGTVHWHKRDITSLNKWCALQQTCFLRLKV